MMREVQEIEDEEHEQILERVCAIDVAKASGMVCTRVPHPSRAGARRTRVWEVDATTNAVLELGEQLAGERIEKVTKADIRRVANQTFTSDNRTVGIIEFAGGPPGAGAGPQGGGQ